MSNIIQFPRQVLSESKKGKEWRKSMLDWASSKTFFNSSPVRKSVENKKINYDLLNGILHMEDIAKVLDPDNIKHGLIPNQIQHFPIINTKLEVLRGEESKRVFDYRFVVTNPTSVTEVEEAKKAMVLQRLQAIVESAQSEEEAQKQTEKLAEYSTYEWQDWREMWCNAVAHHYSLELDFNSSFNAGFMDAMTVAEEIYQCDIVGGEPTLSRLNPLNVRVFGSGYSNRIEDADAIIIEDYWSPGRIIDTFYDQLKQKDVEYIERASVKGGSEALDSEGNVDERYGFVRNYMKDDLMSSTDLFETASRGSSLMPFDSLGNVRVLRLYWKSKRKIKKIKYYDPNTGEEQFTFMAESYVANKYMGEEETVFWINEAWEGTKIGDDVYVNMRPRIVQYNSISNPSKCHFGIIGSIYNINESMPYSLVDRMKPFNYLYDVIHDRLNKTMARNWGKIVKIDLGKIPQSWDIQKWLYFAQTNGLAIEDSRNVINEGPATGKLVASLNNASNGVLDADWGNNIQQYIQLLEYIKSEMSEVAGISKQREGQISNRETVGGVERATLQSSHITEWLFTQHDNLKKRVIECFIETAKIAMKGGSKKFEYILPDNSKRVLEIDGDLFAESDYGIVLDNTNESQKLNQNIDQIAQIALQSQKISLSSVLKLYTSASLAEKMRMLQNEEQKTIQQQQEMQQQQLQAQQEAAQMQQQAAQQKMQMDMQMNAENNETKILVAQIQGQARIQDDLNGKGDGIEEPMSEEAKAKLAESIRQFDEKIKLDRQRLEFDKEKSKRDADLKRKQINNR